MSDRPLRAPGHPFLDYEFRDGQIWCPGFNQEVMMEWEAPIMERMAREVCHNRGDILEVGFGMGISASFIQGHQPRSHTIVECHPQILERLHDWARDKPGVQVVEGMWQEVLSSLGEFDGILWDTFGGVDSFSNRGLFPPFFHFVCKSLRPLGRFTFWHPLPDPIPTWNYGLTGVEWETIAVNPPPNHYFEFQTYCLPVWTQEPAEQQPVEQSTETHEQCPPDDRSPPRSTGPAIAA